MCGFEGLGPVRRFASLTPTPVRFAHPYAGSLRSPLHRVRFAHPYTGFASLTLERLD